MTEPLQADQHVERRGWLAVLARADTAELEAHARRVGPLPAAQAVRPPEVGMTMLRGRVGGTGATFNFGEASLTRCAMRIANGPLGVGYALGRDRRKAELIAVFDALSQDPGWAPRIKQDVIEPLRERQAQQREAASRAVAGSRVEFFTMVRGEA